MINRSDPHCVGVQFCYHSYDYRLNWTPLSHIASYENHPPNDTSTLKPFSVVCLSHVADSKCASQCSTPKPNQ